MEVFRCNDEVKAKSYFQFRFILWGKSFCSLDFPAFKNSIQKLKYAVLQAEKDHTKIIGDSALYKMLDYSTDKSEDKSR